MKKETLTYCLNVGFQNWQVYNPDLPMLLKLWFKQFSDIADAVFEKAFENLMTNSKKFPTIAEAWVAINDERRNLPQKSGTRYNPVHSEEYYRCCVEVYGQASKKMDKYLEPSEMKALIAECDMNFRRLCSERGVKCL